MIEREAEGGGTNECEHTWTVILADSAEALSQCLVHAPRVSPPERTVVVVTASRPVGLGSLPPDAAHVLVEPLDRGSAASVLFPVHWVHARDRKAAVVVFRGDRAEHSARALGPRLGSAIRYAERRPDRIVLVGEADRGETEGARLIVPGDRLETADDAWVYGVQALVECEGSDAPARALRDAGIVAGSATAIIDAGATGCASLVDRLARAVTFAGQEHERWALRQAYALAEPAGAFGALLAGALSSLAVIAVAEAGVSEIDLPERAAGARVLLRLGSPGSLVPVSVPRATAALST